MSRSGYSDDCEHLELWRANVDSALRGKRGQKFLRELASAMDAMPEKKLIRGELISARGECCTIGVVCKLRNLDVSKVDVYEPEEVGKLVGISRVMAAEIEHMNDNWVDDPTPEARWERMRKWVQENIKDETDD